MNVRFFGGKKSEYVNIPKHNPIADSRELFLGDRLLSDGMRVVPTFADLPSISEHKAAEGVIYFVEATKNGYVLPRGGSEWLQVIYAPTTGGSTDVDLSNYYTKAEVNEAILKAIANIEVEVDLSGYATKEELEAIDAKIPSIEGLASEDFVKSEIAKAELNSGEVTEEELTNLLANYYNKTEIDNNFATTETVNQITENIENTYVTNTALEETKQEIANTYITEQHITENYITIQEAADTYVTAEKVAEVVETQVDEVVTTQIETKVETIIQEKVDTGEIAVKAETISYDTW